MTEKQELEFEMKDEYDFSTARPNPYAERIRLHGNNLIAIEPDLFEIFPNSDAVNDALRLIVKQKDATADTHAVKLLVAEAKAS